MRELRGAPEPSLAELLALLAPVDVVLIEGFRRDPIAKIEVFRAASGRPPLFPEEPRIAALVCDGPPAAGLPRAPIDDIAAAADLVLRYAEPVATVIERMRR